MIDQENLCAGLFVLGIVVWVVTEIRDHTTFRKELRESGEHWRRQYERQREQEVLAAERLERPQRLMAGLESDGTVGGTFWEWEWEEPE